jgi:hypothetical protein
MIYKMEVLIIPSIKFPILLNIYSPINTWKNNEVEVSPKNENIKHIHKSFPLYTKKEKARIIRSNSWSD